jgi:anti-sigma factor RsiW
MIERTEHPACVAFEPSLAAYVDDELPAARRAELENHLAACGECRQWVDCERFARQMVRARRDRLGSCASAQLKKRCAACAWTGSAPRSLAGSQRLVRRAWLPLSFAATVLLAGGAVFVLGNLSPESLGAQFALDHLKCFQYAPAHTVVDPEVAAEAWSHNYGWAIRVPRSEPVEELELLDVRRCLSTEGITAHILYKWRGAPLSVYVLNDAARGDTGREHAVARFGKQAIVWTAAGRTYAVVADGTPTDLQRVAHYVQTSAQVIPREGLR